MSLAYAYVIIYATQIFTCAVGLIGLRKYKQLTLPVRLLEWYIIASIMVDCVQDVMSFKNIHTYWVSQSFNIVELLLFSGIFYAWRTSRRNGLIVWGGFLAYLSIWTIGKFTFEPLNGWENYSGPITQIIQIGFCGWLLLEVLKETNIVWKEDVRFWVLSGILLYDASTFLLESNRKLLKMIWPLNAVFIVMQYVFFLRAFLCKPVRAGTINTSQTIYKE